VVKKKNDVIWVPEGIRHKGLKYVVGNDEGLCYYTQFSQLSEKAMKHYGVARRYKNAERVESDLAALKLCASAPLLSSSIILLM
jgi:hypothetical protein